MIILHGNWVAGRLWLWGESSATGMKNDGASPFDAGSRLIAKALVAIAGGSAAARVRHTRIVTAHLPTRMGVPVASRGALVPLTGELCIPDDAPVSLAEWKVAALPLSWAETCAVLSVCTKDERLGTRLLVGADLMQLSLLWRFAAAVSARQTFAPSAVRVEDEKGDIRYESRWLAVLSAADRGRLEKLISMLPPSAFCIEAEGNGKILRPASGEEFFNDVFDRLVRLSAASTLARAHARHWNFLDPHSAWLASLRTENRVIRWEDADELDGLVEMLEDWGRPVHRQNMEGLTLLFRMHDPVNPNDVNPIWKLEVLVYDAANDGAIIPFDECYAAQTSRRREALLTALGQAAQIAPLLNDGRKSKALHVPPTSAAKNKTRKSAPESVLAGIPLEAPEALEFLSETAPLLRGAGFRIENPEWWAKETGGRAQIQVRAVLEEAKGTDAEPKGGAPEFSLDELQKVHWELVLGEQSISPDEVKALLSNGNSIVRWRDKWVVADKAEYANALKLLKEYSSKELTMRDLIRMQIGAAGELPVGVKGLESNTNTAALLQALQSPASIQMLEPPKEFLGSLRPYQVRGFSWMAFLQRWEFGCCLADDMGLGKTIQTLSLFLKLRAEGRDKPILIVCPTSILTNWKCEAEKFAPSLKVVLHHGDERAQGANFLKQAEESIVITSYNLLCRDFVTINQIEWDMVVLDEAQNIKNPTTMKFKAARSLRARTRVVLTGTPVENHAGDLWSIMEFLNPGLLGTRASFNKRFLLPIRMGTDTNAPEVLRQITSPFILRRRKTDPAIIQDLPARIESKVYCTLTKEQAALYGDVLATLDRKMPHGPASDRRGTVFTAIMHLKQICNHPVHFLGEGESSNTEPSTIAARNDFIDPLRSGKMERLDALLDEVIAAKECALVFTQYATMGALLQRHLRQRLGYDIPFLHGGIPLKERDALVARFQSPDGPPVFILSIKAGGTGLNLTRANHVFLFDRWWNPAVESQATDRAHRIGQTRTVFIHSFVCSGTLEARIDKLVSNKAAMAEALVTSGEGWLASLSNEQLREVLALSSEALQPDEAESEK